MVNHGWRGLHPWFTIDCCVCNCTVSTWHWTAACTAGGCRVFILQGVCWLNSIRWWTKCVMINLLMAPTKLAIWLARTHRVCRSGPINPLHCLFFWPSGPIVFNMWVKDSVDAVMMVYVNTPIFMLLCKELQIALNCFCLVWNTDLSLFCDLKEFVSCYILKKCHMIRLEEVKKSIMFSLSHNKV